MPTTRQIPEEAVKDVSFNAPHLWLLGAGASIHALPRGDKNGRQLPLMKNLVEVVGIQELLDNYSVRYRNRSFEDVYDQLSRDPQYQDLCRQIEGAIFKYFAQLELPDEPCLYDYLVWSLRSKDVIATFNWDPLLWQACVRAAPYLDPPHVVFLHGNVAVGYCMRDMIKGNARTACDNCGVPLITPRLLYPVSQKNYAAPELATEWRDLRTALKGAYFVTVFGYSAPRTDVEAIAMLKEGWGNSDDRQLEEFEIIDIRPENEVLESWRSFIHGGHCSYLSDFRHSWLLHHPRRSCEALFAAVMKGAPYRDDPLPQVPTFDALQIFFEPYFAAEAD